MFGMVNALELFDAALLGVVEFACRYRRHQRMQVRRHTIGVTDLFRVHRLGAAAPT